MSRYLVAKYKFVGSDDNLIVLVDSKIVGFIYRNKQAEITCRRDGTWLTGPRWEIFTKEGKQLKEQPAVKSDAARWLCKHLGIAPMKGKVLK